MPTQRLTVATIAGEAGKTVAGLFAKWHATQADGEQDEVRSAVDEFVKQLLTRGGIPPVVYYCEWFDCWSMGDDIHFGTTVEGKQFEASCGSRGEAIDWAEKLPNQFPEQEWLAARLRGASQAWQLLCQQATVVISRQVLGPLYTDEEVLASLSDVRLFAIGPENLDN